VRLRADVPYVVDRDIDEQRARGRVAELSLARVINV